MCSLHKPLIHCVFSCVFCWIFFYRIPNCTPYSNFILWAIFIFILHSIQVEFDVEVEVEVAYCQPGDKSSLAAVIAFVFKLLFCGSLF